uniref:Keratin-associated protein n=1 Tax=Ornithorhynchus anatinus TaxID=9258 RepID=A0A6I8MZA4_ORNAN
MSPVACCSAGPILGGLCPVPAAPSVTLCSGDVSCGDALCLPGACPGGSWLLDNCQETCCEPSGCGPVGCGGRGSCGRSPTLSSLCLTSLPQPSSCPWLVYLSSALNKLFCLASNPGPSRSPFPAVSTILWSWPGPSPASTFTDQTGERGRRGRVLCSSPGATFDPHSAQRSGEGDAH